MIVDLPDDEALEVRRACEMERAAQNLYLAQGIADADECARRVTLLDRALVKLGGTKFPARAGASKVFEGEPKRPCAPCPDCRSLPGVQVVPTPGGDARYVTCKTCGGSKRVPCAPAASAALILAPFIVGADDDGIAL